MQHPSVCTPREDLVLCPAVGRHVKLPQPMRCPSHLSRKSCDPRIEALLNFEWVTGHEG